MTFLLKSEIQTKIGFKIKSRGDCELLSNIILETIDKSISYNTLSRMFLVSKETKPNSNTLNILSEYLGYKSYVHFTQNFFLKEKSNFFTLLFEIVNNPKEDEMVILVKSIYNSSDDFINLIIILSRELFHLKRYDLLNKLFNLKELNYENFTYSEALLLGNSIGLLLRVQKLDSEIILLTNTNFLKCVYLTFVDYSSLTGYYGNWTSSISKTTKLTDITYFCEAITQLKNFLLLKNVNDRVEYSPTLHDLHPILLGRILSIKILANNYETIELLLAPYFQSNDKKNTFQLELSYELTIIAIITGNIKLMGYLVNEISPNIKPKFYYQKQHINIYYLMCMFYYKLINKEPEKKLFSEHYKPKEKRANYEEFINLIVLIFNYSETDSLELKSIYKARYLSLATQLNYPYFSENLLNQYFNDLRNPRVV